MTIALIILGVAVSGSLFALAIHYIVRNEEKRQLAERFKEVLTPDPHKALLAKYACPDSPEELAEINRQSWR